MIYTDQIVNRLVQENGYITDGFRILLDSLRTKVNNVSTISTSIEVDGDLFITVDNLYFANGLWPLTTPEESSVLYRDATEAMSWQLPEDLNLSPETGKIEIYFGGTAPSGWVLFNGGTIGNATSGGTCRANADTADLFSYLWNLFSDLIAPVSSGRGASATADFAANKTITLTNLAARILAVSNGVQLEKAGDSSYYLAAANLPAHQHLAWYRDPLDGGVIDPMSQAFLHQSNLAKSGTYVGSIWTDQFEVNNSRYDFTTFTEFNVEQPSVNVNLIIKL